MEKRVGQPIHHTVSIIGAGAVGSALSILLHRHSFIIDAIISRNVISAARLARRVRAKRACSLKALNTPLRGILFLAVPDDAIKDTVTELKKRKLVGKKTMIYHTSGALASDILLPARNAGACIGSFHPLQTFPKGAKTVPTLKGSTIALEGDKEAIRIGSRIAKVLGSFPLVLTKEEKVIYHIAAVFSSNYLVTLFGAIEELGSQLRLTPSKTHLLFKPLVDSTLRNLRTFSAQKALTGPIHRGDLETIRKHLETLSRFPNRHLLELYASLGLATVRLTKKKMRHDR
jgi:predicted short-subunit dehydrogenase-like oxidoreductase (DUF2520 family)